MPAFEDAYQAACESGLLPGVVLLASSINGEFNYAKAIGVRSLKPGDSAKPMELDSVLAIWSCTKLMTAISALQCVERGLFGLDDDVSHVLPEVGKFGIITGFDDTAGQPITHENTKPITLRHLLTHTSGYAYDKGGPLLEWRASRGEKPWSGPTVEEKSAYPLVFEPGTSWSYGSGCEWTGKMIERVTGETLETFMAKNIWEPLNIKDITFWPKKRTNMKDRCADLSTLDSSGNGKAVDASDREIDGPLTDCLGGEGAYGSAKAYMTFLQAVLKHDPKLLNAQSYKELFKPQLDEQCNTALQDLMLSNPLLGEFLSINVPISGQKNFSFAGLLSTDEYPGWMGKNTVLWGGMPNIIWFVDREVGLCALAACQILPPMEPRIMDLHKQFQHEIYSLFSNSSEL